MRDKNRGRGRPKGSKNKPKAAIEPQMSRDEMIKQYREMERVRERKEQWQSAGISAAIMLYVAVLLAFLVGSDPNVNSTGDLFVLTGIGLMVCTVFPGMVLWVAADHVKSSLAGSLTVSLGTLLLGVLLNHGGFSWWLLVPVVAIMEVWFWFFDKAKPSEQEGRFWFAAKRKLVAFLVGLAAIPAWGLVVFSRRLAWPWLRAHAGIIGKGALTVLCWVGVLVAVVGVVALVVWLNSLKYRKNDKEVGR